MVWSAFALRNDKIRYIPPFSDADADQSGRAADTHRSLFLSFLFSFVSHNIGDILLEDDDNERGAGTSSSESKFRQ